MPTKLSLEQVEHIAELAKLRLTDEEKERFREQLSDILAYAERLQALDTEAIPPTATVLPLRTVLRPDAPQPSMPREDILANAPAAQDGCFVVPAVLD
ncbi:MAG: Asp-tRNA(Asn)/Glu-tRNA(Gln) amidotransferase GatCAB subunit C [Chloroflexota bacterium]